jgi:outer membrane protein assembly factor BamD (BamD/ComL family)
MQIRKGARNRTRAAIALVTMVLLAGCSLWHRVRSKPQSGVELLAQADALMRDGKPKEAAAIYEQLVGDRAADGDRSPDPVRAQALHTLGQLQVDPKSPVRDYRAARRTFERLVTDYPQSPWTPEARAWRAVLLELERRDADTVRLREDLDRLKELDMNMERRR